MRNILTHAYSGISIEIVWDVVRNKVPSLHRAATGLLERLDS